MSRRSHPLTDTGIPDARRRDRTFRFWAAASAVALIIFGVLHAGKPTYLTSSPGGASSRAGVRARIESAAARSENRVLARGTTVLHGLSLSQVTEMDGQTNLSADEMRIQKRVGLRGYVVYQDARDLLLRDARLTIRLGRGVPLNFPSIPAEMSELLGIESAENNFNARSDSLNIVTRDAAGAFISRVRFDGLTIDTEGRTGQRLVMISRSARFDPMTRTLVLEGGVEIETPEGDLIQTGQGVVSPDLLGLYLPMSHRHNDMHVAERTSISLDPRGRLAVKQKPGTVRATDRLEELEHLLFSKYVDKLPAALRAAFFPGLAP